MEILEQIGQLVLGSLPTVGIFLLLLGAYVVLVYRPLTRALGERHQQTEGAIEKARQAIATAEARTGEYEAKMREARQSLAAAREARMQQWNAEREKALAGAREAAQDRVRQSRAEVEASTEAARKSIEGAAGQLAAKILSQLMPVAAGQGERAH